MTKAEQIEYYRLVKLMTKHIDSPTIAKIGQEYHEKLSEKYGEQFALAITDQMMQEVFDARMQYFTSAKCQSTGEVLEWVLL